MYNFIAEDIFLIHCVKHMEQLLKQFIGLQHPLACKDWPELLQIFLRFDVFMVVTLKMIHLLGLDTVYCDRSLLRFWRNVLLPSSEYYSS